MYGQEWIDNEYEKIDVFVTKCRVTDNEYSDIVKQYLKSQMPQPIMPGHPIQCVALDDVMEQIWQRIIMEHKVPDTILNVSIIFESEYEALKDAWSLFKNDIIDGTVLFLQYMRFDAALNKLDALVSKETDRIPNGIEEINLIQWHPNHGLGAKETLIVGMENHLRRFDILFKYLKQALRENDETLFQSIGMYLSLLGLSMSRIMSELKDY